MVVISIIYNVVAWENLSHGESVTFSTIYSLDKYRVLWTERWFSFAWITTTSFPSTCPFWHALCEETTHLASEGLGAFSQNDWFYHWIWYNLESLGMIKKNKYKHFWWNICKVESLTFWYALILSDYPYSTLYTKNDILANENIPIIWSTIINHFLELFFFF